MNSHRMFSYGVAAALLGLAAATVAQASPEGLDLDTRFRAKLAKEKVKRSALESRFGDAGGNGDGVGSLGASCGNQNIGVIDNSGRKGGPPPREIFVFAPNAVNIVNSRGCN
jgi:hypothetical protein